jgi:alpha-aminoadipate carrier protein LysW
MTMPKIKCPDCGAEFDAPQDASPGEIVSCPDCGLELEIKSIKGDVVEVKELAVEGEDWGE